MKIRTLPRVVSAAAIAVVATLGASSVSTAQEHTIALRQQSEVGGYLGAEDVFLQNDPKDARRAEGNFAGHPMLYAGKYQGSRLKSLIRFDLTHLRGRFKEIRAVRLRLSPIGGQAPAGTEVHLYRVTPANKGWSAGNTGNTPAPRQGGPSWNYLAYDATEDVNTRLPLHTPWKGSPGLGTPKVDYIAEPLAVAQIGTGEVVLQFRSTDFLKEWIENKAENAGFLLDVPAADKAGPNFFGRYASSESGEAALRPRLEIDVTGWQPETKQGISFKLPRDGRVSLNVSDQNGKVVRELLHAKVLAAGDNIVAWDALPDPYDKDDKPVAVPDGTYNWKLLQTPGLKAEYLLTLGTNIKEGPLLWTGSHQGVFGIAADDNAMYVSGGINEGARRAVAVRLDDSEKYLWQSMNVGGGWWGFVSAASDGKYLYGLIPGNQNKTQKLMRLNAATGAIVNAWDFPCDTYDDIAVRDGQMVTSQFDANTVTWVDPSNGKAAETISIPKPSSVAIDSKGRVLVVSEGRVLRVERAAPTPVPLIEANLNSAWRVVVDLTNDDILVAENRLGGTSGKAEAGPGHQVKRFSSDGQLKAAYGAAQGRPLQGRYDADGFFAIHDIAAVKDGGFIVTEPHVAPRRTARYDKDGRLVREWYGAQYYSTWSVPDPRDPRDVWFDSQHGWLVHAKVDYQNRSWKVHANYRYAGLAGGLVTGPVINGPKWLVRHHDGETYLCREGLPTVLRVDEANRRLVTVTVYRKLTLDDYEKLPAATQKLFPKPGKTAVLAMWTDSDGNGEISPSEGSVSDTVFAYDGGFVDADFTIHFNDKKGRIRSFAPLGWQGKVLRYPAWSEANIKTVWEPSAGQLFGLHPVFYTSMSWRDEAGNNYAGFNTNVFPAAKRFGVGVWSQRSGGQRVVKISPDGKLQWMVGRHAPAAQAAPGEAKLLNRIAGVVEGNVVVTDFENSYVHVWDRDGLWVGRLFDNVDERYPRQWAYDFGGEHFAGRIYQVPAGANITGLNPGDVLFFGAANTGVSVSRITGWDGWERQSGTVQVKNGVVTPLQ